MWNLSIELLNTLLIGLLLYRSFKPAAIAATVAESAPQTVPIQSIKSTWDHPLTRINEHSFKPKKAMNG